MGTSQEFTPTIFKGTQVRDLRNAVGRVRMAIIHLQQDKLAVAAPENQSGLLTIRILCQGVRNYVCATPTDA